MSGETCWVILAFQQSYFSFCVIFLAFISKIRTCTLIFHPAAIAIINLLIVSVIFKQKGQGNNIWYAVDSVPLI